MVTLRYRRQERFFFTNVDYVDYLNKDYRKISNELEINMLTTCTYTHRRRFSNGYWFQITHFVGYLDYYSHTAYYSKYYSPKYKTYFLI